MLLLEDLAPARNGDSVTGCSFAETELAIGHIAKLHAAFWEIPHLAGLDWLQVDDKHYHNRRQWCGKGTSDETAQRTP